jgi:hypothetical protein
VQGVQTLNNTISHYMVMMPAGDMSSLNNLEINIIRYIHKEILTKPVNMLY